MRRGLSSRPRLRPNSKLPASKDTMSTPRKSKITWKEHLLCQSTKHKRQSLWRSFYTCITHKKILGPLSYPSPRKPLRIAVSLSGLPIAPNYYQKKRDSGGLQTLYCHNIHTRYMGRCMNSGTPGTLACMWIAHGFQKGDCSL